MTAGDALSLLRQQQGLLLETVKSNAEDYAAQFHPDLSPLGWHLGHCVYTESYWLREVLMGMAPISEEQKALYIPELSEKNTRGTVMPGHVELCAWAEQTQATNLDYLRDLVVAGKDTRLMRENYLVHFLCQHYAQHLETSRYVLTQRNLKIASDYRVDEPLQTAPLRDNFAQIDAGSYTIGATGYLKHYDNECPRFRIQLDACYIQQQPVSNAEFLGFIEDGGYKRRECWDDKGWQWLTQSKVSFPQHWRANATGHFYGTDANGPCPLGAEMPVSGLCHHEASALARWAGARLPHEYEWEVASNAGLLSGTGHAWEWCQNPFHPYAGFEAFPYAGYSEPWFDKQHFSLRGASQYTQDLIARASFRNFFRADVRHIPAGVRLARN